MTLSTLIYSGLVRQERAKSALVLMGGGARTAYQAGVLLALSRMIADDPAAKQQFPFQLLVGTSAGALNAAFLASRAHRGVRALGQLAQFWQDLRSEQVYRLHLPGWSRFSRIATAWQLSRQLREMGSLLDNMPLVDTLHKAISLAGIDEALALGANKSASPAGLHALAVTASSYTSGVHWTFCHTTKDSRQQPWQRPGRRAAFQPITMEHLMASSAIPLIFPAQPIWVDGHSEYFGDGSMRQTSPLSPALHLGARKVLVIGVGQPERSSLVSTQGDKLKAESMTQGTLFTAQNHEQNRHLAPMNPISLATDSRANRVATGRSAAAPGVGGVLGYALASVFHDTLRGDVEQAQRMNDTLDQLPREIAAVLPYQRVQVLCVQPSESLDDLALAHAHALPVTVRGALQALAGKAGSAGAGAALASYLLFEPEFTQPLIALGQRDALTQKEKFKAFLQG